MITFSTVIDFINVSVNSVFFFTPEILSMFALSILVLDINRYLDKSESKKSKIFKYFIDTVYLIYTFFRMIPLENLNSALNFSFDYNNPFEILTTVFAILPYIAMVLLGKIIAKNKFVKIFLNYYTMHVYFVIFAFVWNYLYPGTVDLWWACIYAFSSPVISNFIEFKKR